jgi:glutamate/tyrosine decarboxylase-like PLP-dependent enzyme
LPGGRLDADALRGAIAAGATPALLVGSAVTVNTGVIDPLDALAEVAAAERSDSTSMGLTAPSGCSTPAVAARYGAWSAPTR